MSVNKIKNIAVQYFKVPLLGNMVDALHGKHDNFQLITATVTLEDGREGTGYTYTGGFGGVAIADVIKNDLVPSLIGKEMLTPQEMNEFMCKRIHYVARGGIASFAISALDIAFWDIMLKSKNMALADYFGTRADKVRTYYGGIDLMLSQKELLEGIEKQLKNGHTAFKIKVGRQNSNEDIERVKAVRELIGKDAMFMIDANMVWSVPQAIEMAQKLEKYNIFWLEEPTDPDNYVGYAQIGQATQIPISMGENLHTLQEHKMALDIGRIKYSIPDASNIGGITGFFDVAKLTQERSLLVSSHGMQELHVNILGALANRGFMEYHSFPICDYTINPIKVENGFVQVSKEPGTGVEFDWKKLAPHKQF